MANAVLCRLCAAEKDCFVDGYLYIYSDEGVKLGLERKITSFLNIELQASDGLPKTVCFECCSKLRQCADFVASSQAAQARLYALLGLQVKNEVPCDFPLSGDAVVKLEREANCDGIANTGDGDADADADADDDGDEPLVLSEQIGGWQGAGDDNNQAPRFLEILVGKSANSKSTGSNGGNKSRPSNKRKGRLPVRVNVEPQLFDDGADDGADERTQDQDRDRDRDEDDDVEVHDVDDGDGDGEEEGEVDKDDDVVVVEEGRRRGRGRGRGRSRQRSSAPRFQELDSCESDFEADDDDDSMAILDATDDNSKARTRTGKTGHKKGKSLDLENYSWMCSDCSEQFTELKELKAHHTEEHKQQPKFMCMDCSKVFTKYSGFLGHVRQLHRNYSYGQYRCEDCGRCFPHKKVLDSHRLTHAEKRQHVCRECGKSFLQKSALYVHSKCHLPDDLRHKHACDQCDKTFSTKPNLITHKLIHAGVRNFTCDQCGKSFIQKGNLDAHILTHSSVKPHVCSMCGKAFKTEVQLRKHGSVHTGVKPHQCDICGRQFRERGTLREHHRIHTGAMPFSCDYCGKSFRFKGVLTTHRRQHTGERPYSCLECQHHFTNWPNYNKHMKRRHGVNTSRQARAALEQQNSAVVAAAVAAAAAAARAGEADGGAGGVAPAAAAAAATAATPVGGGGGAPLAHTLPLHTNNQHGLQQHTMDVHKQMLNVSDSQNQALLHKTHGQVDLAMYHDNSHSSRHGHEAVESQPLAHKMPQMYPMHSSSQAVPVPSHSNINVHDDVHREVIGDRERAAQFYNPVPGQGGNSNPYLHHGSPINFQTLRQSIQQSLHLSQSPSLYGIPQLPLDAGHLEMLHSSGQHR